jgi:quercetin dioxygenase-like cupin family protein
MSSNYSKSSPSNFRFVVGVVAGIFMGMLLQRNFSQLAESSSQSDGGLKGSPAHQPKTTQAQRGMVKSLEDVPVRSTSHVDTEGRPITKQQFLEPFEVPNFVGYSVATFLPGQTMMPVHEHESLHEFFYVLEGKGFFQINDDQYEVSKGMFLHMAPGEKHGIWVPIDSKDGALKIAVCGVTVD